MYQAVFLQSSQNNLKRFSRDHWQIWLIYQQDCFPKFLTQLKLFQYLKKKTNKTATIIDLSSSYRILVKLRKNMLIGSFMNFLNLTTIYMPRNLAFAVFIQQIMHYLQSLKKSEKVLIMEKLHWCISRSAKSIWCHWSWNLSLKIRRLWHTWSLTQVV